jgi:hypothetical protein
MLSSEVDVKVNDVVFVESEHRIVTDIKRNNRGEPTVHWRAKNRVQGVCMVSVWQEWVKASPKVTLEEVEKLLKPKPKK